MSSVHHKTAYEEVAVEQDDNNKQQSNKTMIQSKFIYMTFAIVFAVILIQGIVLYCVLKPSSSTKHQLLALDKMINSACKKPTQSIQSTSNNSVSLFGITVDTSPLISKIDSTLSNYDKSTFGRVIRFKQTNECLNGGPVPGYSGYAVFPATCDQSPFQQWRKAQRQINVGSALNYPKFGSSFTPCLACSGYGRSCDLIVHPCEDLKGHASQNFIIRIYPSQIDLVNSRVYFSIHDQLWSTQCLCLHYNGYTNTQTFFLQECIGSDVQSFYLEDADLTKEIDDIRKRLSSYLSSMLLDSSGTHQTCPNSS